MAAMSALKQEEIAESHDAWMHRAKASESALRAADEFFEEFDRDAMHGQGLWRLRYVYETYRKEVCTCDQMCRAGHRECDCLPCHDSETVTR